MGDRPEASPQELLGRVSEELAERAVDLHKTPVEVRQPNADGSILERVSEALEQCARTSLRVTAADDSTGWIYQGDLRMSPVPHGCHHLFR